MTNLVSKLGTAINESITESDFEACHRVPTWNPDKSNIVVQFRSRAKRDSVLKKAKKMRLTNFDLDLGSQEPVYVNEHLCPALKKLLGMAVRRKYEQHWKSVWSYDGKIYAREHDDAPTVQIRCESDLTKIVSHNAPESSGANGSCADSTRTCDTVVGPAGKKK